MIKEAIEKIQSLTTGKVLESYGRAYSVHDLHQLPSPEATATPIRLHTLGGFVEFCSADHRELHPAMEASELGTAYRIVIDGPDRVLLVSGLFGEFRQREILAESKAIVGDAFPFGRYMDPESFIVAVQAHFVITEVTAAILQVVGNIHCESNVQVRDDGVTQEVTARQGIAKMGRVELPNPVVLAPYRTFQELEQPLGKYVFRMRQVKESGPEMALFAVTDEQWQVQCISQIRGYLQDRVDLPIFA
mgnify:CR=1 FL=1